MILTNWGKTNGSPQVSFISTSHSQRPLASTTRADYNLCTTTILQEGSGSSAVTGDESMWLKIVSQWVFLILYLRVLQVAYNNNT
jgi:hypothetical protein